MNINLHTVLILRGRVVHANGRKGLHWIWLGSSGDPVVLVWHLSHRVVCVGRIAEHTFFEARVSG